VGARAGVALDAGEELWGRWSETYARQASDAMIILSDHQIDRDCTIRATTPHKSPPRHDCNATSSRPVDNLHSLLHRQNSLIEGPCAAPALAAFHDSEQIWRLHRVQSEANGRPQRGFLTAWVSDKFLTNGLPWQAAGISYFPPLVLFGYRTIPLHHGPWLVRLDSLGRGSGPRPPN
jgi:hypothetical protein